MYILSYYGLAFGLLPEWHLEADRGIATPWNSSGADLWKPKDGRLMLKVGRAAGGLCPLGTGDWGRWARLGQTGLTGRLTGLACGRMAPCGRVGW